MDAFGPDGLPFFLAAVFAAFIVTVAARARCGSEMMRNRS
jgi:hypothetical protein